MRVRSCTIRWTALDLRADGLIQAMTFSFLGMARVVLWAAILVAIMVVMITIYLELRRLRLLLVAFRRRSLGSLVTSIVESFVLSLKSLSLVCALSVQRSWFTVSTRVFEIWKVGIVHSIDIKALNMLPSIACFAVDR